MLIISIVDSDNGDLAAEVLSHLLQTRDLLLQCEDQGRGAGRGLREVSNVIQRMRKGRGPGR